MKKDNPSPIRVKLEKELEVITDISMKSSLPIGSIAINYCLLQPNIDGVLIGVDSLQQIKENIAFSQHKIPNQYIDQINTIKIDNIELLNPTLWK
jgi:aryl-alcohol dehydrogenase-like predicted oxidoreductase